MGAETRSSGGAPLQCGGFRRLERDATHGVNPGMSDEANEHELRDPFKLVGVLLDRKYRVDRFVAEGGFGAVYRGLHLALDVPIAIKVLKPSLRGDRDAWHELIARFRDEANVLARIRHPNVVTVLDSGIAPVGDDPTGLPWMALEWLEGETLRDHLAARRGSGGRTPAECMRLLRPVLDAMADAHEAGIVHRDLKPSNIMLVTSKGRVELRILDFGIAKLVDPNEAGPLSGHTATDASSRAFTTASAAPEQLSGARTGAWTDVYALALLLTEVLADASPVSARDANDHYRAAFDAVRPSPRSLGIDAGAWEPILASALAVTPADRPKDARALLLALDGALDQATNVPVAPLAASMPATASAKWHESTTDRRPRRTGLRWGAPVLGVLAIAGVALFARTRAGAPVVQPVDAGPPVLPATATMNAREVMSLDASVGIPTLAFDHAGKRAAFADMQAIWVVSLDGKDKQRVAPPPELVPELSSCRIEFFPDDARLLVSGTHAQSLWIVPIDGAPPTRGRDVPPAERVRVTALAPDGTHVAFQGSDGMYVGDVTGGPSTRIAPLPSTAYTWFTWSPDGTRLALLSFSPLESGRLDIVSADGVTVRTVHRSSFLVFDWSGAAWTGPDRVAFFENDRLDRLRLKEINVDATPTPPPRVLWTGPGQFPSAFEFRHGRILVGRYESPARIGLLHWRPGGAPLDEPFRWITPTDSSEFLLAWTPEGRIFSSAGEGDAVRMMARPVNGDAPDVLFAERGAAYGAAPLPDRNLLVFRIPPGEKNAHLVHTTPDGKEHDLFPLAGAELVEGWVRSCVRCGVAGTSCIAFERSGDRNEFFEFDPATGVRRAPFFRAPPRAGHLACALDDQAHTMVIPGNRLTVVDVRTGKSREVDTGLGADVQINSALPVPDGFLVGGQIAPGPPFALWHVSPAGKSTVIRKNDTEWMIRPRLSPDGAELAVRVHTQRGSVLSLEP